MSESERALSAQEFYEQILAADVSAGRLGALRLVPDCERCSPPKGKIEKLVCLNFVCPNASRPPLTDQSKTK